VPAREPVILWARAAKSCARRAPRAIARSPKEILYGQVYTSFQHDESATGTMIEFGYDQKTLHELFDDVPEAVRRRITRDAYRELFPSPAPPTTD
jgi:hypothetical protein